MKTYLVTWSIDIDADNAIEAAVQALIIQRDHESTALVFSVREHGTTDTQEIDLGDESA